MEEYPGAILLRRRSMPKAGFDYRPRHAIVAYSEGMHEEKPQSLLHQARELFLILVLAILLSSALRAFLVQAFWIPSSSMEDTLQVGDNVLVSRLTPGVFDLERGDVVVFRDANEWLGDPPEKTGAAKFFQSALEFTGLRPASGEQHLVKRVIGVGGDTIECCDDGGRLLVNGTPIDEPYLAPGSDNSLQPFKVTVPDRHLWVMGDNRNHSADSRAHMVIPDLAYVDENDVVGKVFFVSWPFDHWSNPTNNEPFEAVE
ncbi:MAG: signal peptidase I [Actinomycetaceae bacterium]|nr:signal peptidase I [Actinomycetaceae bacterium]